MRISLRTSTITRFELLSGIDDEVIMSQIYGPDTQYYLLWRSVSKFVDTCTLSLPVLRAGGSCLRVKEREPVWYY